MALKGQTVHLQDAQNTFAIDRRLALGPELPVQKGCEAAIAIGGR
jgi:hypothetical protein